MQYKYMDTLYRDEKMDTVKTLKETYKAQTILSKHRL